MISSRSLLPFLCIDRTTNLPTTENFRIIKIVRNQVSRSCIVYESLSVRCAQSYFIGSNTENLSLITLFSLLSIIEGICFVLHSVVFDDQESTDQEFCKVFLIEGKLDFSIENSVSTIIKSLFILLASKRVWKNYSNRMFPMAV